MSRATFEYEGGYQGLKETFDFNHTFFLWLGTIDVNRCYHDCVEIIPEPDHDVVKVRIQIRKRYFDLSAREKKLLVLRIAFTYGIDTESTTVYTLLSSFD